MHVWAWGASCRLWYYICAVGALAKWWEIWAASVRAGEMIWPLSNVCAFFSSSSDTRGQTAHCEPKHPLPLHITIGTRPYSSYFQCGLCTGALYISCAGAKPAAAPYRCCCGMASNTHIISTVCFMASALWETLLAAFGRRGTLWNWQKWHWNEIEPFPSTPSRHYMRHAGGNAARICGFNNIEWKGRNIWVRTLFPKITINSQNSTFHWWV